MTASLLRRPKPRRRSELGLLTVGAIVIFFGSLLGSFGLSDALPRGEFIFILGMSFLAASVQLLNRWLVPDADPIIMPIVLVLNGLGYIMIQRLAPALESAGYGLESGQQLAWTVLGVLLYATVLIVVRRSRDLERYRYMMLALAFFLLMSPLIPKFGKNINGARLWVAVGGIQFQPVEIAKLLLVIFFASYFVEKREMLTIPTRRIGNHLIPDLRAFGPVIVAGAISLLVILAEHDIGFALLLFVVFLSLIWVTTGRWIYVVIGFIFFALATFVASHVLLQVNQRFEIWLDPWKYFAAPSNGLGYQPVQGELAFGRGGLFGSGLGLGHVGSIPIPTSDFIFAAFGEELGITGSIAIVAAFMLLVGAGLRASLRARSEFAKLTALGLTAVIGFQAFFIMAGVVRLLPLTGVTLPFVSYGGSSLVANYILVALLMRISNEGNQLTPDFSKPTWSSTSGAATIGATRP